MKLVHATCNGIIHHGRLLSLATSLRYTSCDASFLHLQMVQFGGQCLFGHKLICCNVLIIIIIIMS